MVCDVYFSTPEIFILARLYHGMCVCVCVRFLEIIVIASRYVCVCVCARFLEIIVIALGVLSEAS